MVLDKMWDQAALYLYCVYCVTDTDDKLLRILPITVQIYGLKFYKITLDTT